VTIVINEHLLGMWFVEIPTGDWMAGLSEKDGTFTLDYRFRYYTKGPAPLGVWDGSDRKSWYVATCDRKEPLIAAARDLARMAAALHPGKSYELMRGDKSTREFADELMAAPFAHMRKATKAEYEQYQRDGRLPP
jgi:hypothetical protein